MISDSDALIVPGQSRAFGYARVSTAEQAEHGESLEGQESRVREFFDRVLRPRGVAWAGMYVDPGVSASKLEFGDRPGGRMALRDMREFDHLIFDKIDRLWRSAYDYQQLNRYFENKNMMFHVVDFMGDTIRSNSYVMKFAINMMVCVAELEARIKSQRIQDVNEAKRAKGFCSQPISRVPTLCKMKNVPGGRILVWDEQALAIAERVVAMKDEDSLSFEAIACKLESEFRGEHYEMSSFDPPNISAMRIRTYYRRYKLYEAARIEDPRTIVIAKLVKNFPEWE
jgi:DNA invertase Pin-like site-specific DNA recombinase